jgi:peptidoglycan/LPS O-acetylase OafA/YrhL
VSARSQFFTGLDGLRGLAALTVVMWHTQALFGFGPGSGYLAVDVFFILSGFVMAHAYDHKLEQGMGVVEFMRVRLIRLYPLYALSLLMIVGALTLSQMVGQHTNWTPGKIAASTTFSAAFLPTPPDLGSNDSLYPLNTPAWSLGFELIINLLFALAWRWLSMRTLIGIALVAAIAEVAATVAYGSLNTGSTWPTALGALPRVFYSFTAGVILLRLYRVRSVRVPGGSLLPSLVMVALMVVTPPAGTIGVYDLVCAIVMFPVLVMAGASAQPVRLCSAYGFLGAASYAVYALHIPLFAVANGLLVKITHGRLEIAQPWAGICFIGGVMLAAYLADRFYDAPVRRWLRDRST